MQNYFSPLFRSVLQSFRRIFRTQPEPTITPEQFREMFSQMMSDPENRRLILRSMIGTVFPIEGGVNSTNYIPKFDSVGSPTDTVAPVYEDGSGNVGIGTTDKLSRLTVKGRASFSATGTVSVTNNSSAVTGSSTNFTTEVGVGDRVTVSGQTRTVNAIASDTSLTVDANFTTTASGQTMTVLPSLFRADDSSGTPRLVVSDSGDVGIGTTSPQQKFHVVGPVSLGNESLEFTGNGTMAPDSAAHEFTTFDLPTDFAGNARIEITYGYVSEGAYASRVAAWDLAIRKTNGNPGTLNALLKNVYQTDLGSNTASFATINKGALSGSIYNTAYGSLSRVSLRFAATKSGTATTTYINLYWKITFYGDGACSIVTPASSGTANELAFAETVSSSMQYTGNATTTADGTAYEFTTFDLPANYAGNARIELMYGDNGLGSSGAYASHVAVWDLAMRATNGNPGTLNAILKNIYHTNLGSNTGAFATVNKGTLSGTLYNTAYGSSHRVSLKFADTVSGSSGINSVSLYWVITFYGDLSSPIVTPAVSASNNALAFTETASVYDDNGNVGIGTTNPQSTLEVNGSINQIVFLKPLGGSNNDRPQIQGAIDNLLGNGGIIYLTPGIYNVGSTINVNKNGVKIRGYGGNWSDELGGPVTKLHWAGSSGQTVIEIKPPGTPTTQLQDAEISDLTIDGNSSAGIGLKLDAVQSSKFRNVIARNIASSGGVGFYLTTSSATADCDTGWNLFENCAVIGAAIGLVLDGNGSTTHPANSAHNTFVGFSPLLNSHTGDIGIHLIQCDNNAFYRTYIASTEAGRGVVVENPHAAGDNYFYHLQSDGFYIKSSGSPLTDNEGKNFVFGYDQGNGQGEPSTDSSNTAKNFLAWTNSKGNMSGIGSKLYPNLGAALSASNCPAVNANEFGFVWDGTNLWLVYNDGTNKWKWQGTQIV